MLFELGILGSCKTSLRLFLGSISSTSPNLINDICVPSFRILAERLAGSSGSTSILLRFLAATLFSVVVFVGRSPRAWVVESFELWSLDGLEHLNKSVFLWHMQNTEQTLSFLGAFAKSIRQCQELLRLFFSMWSSSAGPLDLASLKAVGLDLLLG